MTVIRTLLYAAVLLLLATSASFAQEEEEGKKEPAWTGELGLAFLATSGNSDTETFGIDFILEREPDPWGLTALARFNRAEDSGVKTAERYFAQARARRALSDRWEYFFGLSGERDQFAGFDLRAIAETGASYKAIDSPKHRLAFDGGVTWTDEDRIEPEPDTESLGALAGLIYEWKISETSSLTQRLVIYPNFDESDDWRVDSDTALTADISTLFAVKLSYEIRYRNLPIGTNDDTDTTTRVSLVAKF
jgi:putative salt-induced outer membrane protein